MDEGFVLEMGDGNSFTSDIWIAGKPERSWLLGLKLKGKATYEITTFRCTACGYLDSYALRKKW